MTLAVPGDDAARVLAAEFNSLMDNAAVETMLATQTDIHAKLTQAAHTLATFNARSMDEHKQMKRAFDEHVKCLHNLQRDLMAIHKRLRMIRAKLDRAEAGGERN